MSDHDQLMVFMNLGIAFKYLGMINAEREMNDLLNKNNLLLERESQHDEMTGLLNRRGFMNQTSRMLADGVGKRAAIVYLDLDGLKTINDTFGHDAGDMAITQTAQILKQWIAGDNALCRLGGDEFIALVLVDDQSDVDELVEAIQASMRRFNQEHDLPYTLSISSGAALFDVEAASVDDMAQLMAQADERLYLMKRTRKESRRYES
jgi:diguanylate cyclase (GGDEF)-like protein